MSFPIAHYEKNFFICFNGGRLIVTPKEFIIKNLFITVVRFPRAETEIYPAPDDFILRGYYFVSGKKRWKVLFAPTIYEKVSYEIYR